MQSPIVVGGTQPVRASRVDTGIPLLALRGPHRGRRVALISIHGGPLARTGAEGAGGQNVYVREVARGLAAAGFQVDVFTRGRNHTQPEVCTLDGARVIRLPAGPAGFIGRNDLFPYLPEFLQNLQQFTQSEGTVYDLIHTNYWLSGWVGLRWAGQLGVPLMHTHHSLGAVKYAAAGGVPQAALVRLETERELIQQATIVATSTEDVLSMREHYGFSGRAEEVPCGVDDSNFRPLDKLRSRSLLKLPLDEPLVTYVGRFDPQKGIETFVRAAARDPRARLVFAGGYEPGAADEREYQRILQLTEELGVAQRCHFLGKVGHDRLPFVYSAADVCLVPSHYESFGMVCIEAMACGTPVIASDVGGLRHTVVHGETGLLAPVRQDEAWGQALRLMLTDPTGRALMGERAAAHVKQNYTWSVVARGLAGVYARAMDRTRSAWCVA